MCYGTYVHRVPLASFRLCCTHLFMLPAMPLYCMPTPPPPPLAPFLLEAHQETVDFFVFSREH